MSESNIVRTTADAGTHHCPRCRRRKSPSARMCQTCRTNLDQEHALSSAVAASRRRHEDGDTARCPGPGKPFEERCLGDGRMEVGRAARCDACRVERRRRQKSSRGNGNGHAAKRRLDEQRPASFEAALRQAHAVLSARRADEQALHPAAKWQVHEQIDDAGRRVEHTSLDLRYSITNG